MPMPMPAANLLRELNESIKRAKEKGGKKKREIKKKSVPCDGRKVG
jgi:hypothetical protein